MTAKKRSTWNKREQPRKLHRRCDTCGRNDCACDRRGLDEDWLTVPDRLSVRDASDLGVEVTR